MKAFIAVVIGSLLVIPTVFAAEPSVQMCLAKAQYAMMQEPSHHRLRAFITDNQIRLERLHRPESFWVYKATEETMIQSDAKIICQAKIEELQLVLKAGFFEGLKQRSPLALAFLLPMSGAATAKTGCFELHNSRVYQMVSAGNEVSFMGNKILVTDKPVMSEEVDNMTILGLDRGFVYHNEACLARPRNQR